MKLYIEDDNGVMTELKELSEVDSNSEILIFTMNNRIDRERMGMLAERLEEATKKKCIILDSAFGKVYGVK